MVEERVAQVVMQERWESSGAGTVEVGECGMQLEWKAVD